MHKDFAETAADRIVEVYSAAHIIEAQELCTILEDKGIQSRIVGEQLGNAAGCLPLGETLAPRIWVREGDAIQAREIIEEWTKEPHQEWSWPVADEEPNDVEEQPEEKDAPAASGVRFRWLSQAFLMAGVASILIGAVWAWHGWMTMRKYQGTAEGVLVGYQPHLESYIPSRADDNLPGVRRRPTLAIRYDLQYEFVVGGKTYHAVVYDGYIDDGRLPIHYDPCNPEEHIVGPRAQPWIVLVSMLGTGAVLSLIGLYFRRMAVRHSHELQ